MPHAPALHASGHPVVAALCCIRRRFVVAMSGKRELDAAPRTPLQAVVLADSFRQCFRPISVERPKVLMPLVIVPMPTTRSNGCSLPAWRRCLS